MAQGTLAKLAAIICCKGDSSTSRTPSGIIWNKVFLFDGETVLAIATNIIRSIDGLDGRTVDTIALEIISAIEGRTIDAIPLGITRAIDDDDQTVHLALSLIERIDVDPSQIVYAIAQIICAIRGIRHDDGGIRQDVAVAVCARYTSVLNDTLEKSTPMSLNAQGVVDGLTLLYGLAIGGRDIMRDWQQAKIKEVEVEKKEIDSSITTVKNEVYQLGGLYTVFIGVLFTAVSTSSKLECRHIWSPIVLCFMGFLMMAFIAYKKFKFLEDTHVTRTLPNFLQRKVISYCLNKAKAEVDSKVSAHGSQAELQRSRARSRAMLNGEFRVAELYLKFLSQQDVLDENSPARLTWPVGSLKCPKGAKPVDRAPRYIGITLLAAATAVLVGSFVHILCL